MKPQANRFVNREGQFRHVSSHPVTDRNRDTALSVSLHIYFQVYDFIFNVQA
jgi:hypothetical protein